MPSDRKQINVRVDPQTEELMKQLLPVVSEAIGLPVSQSDLFRLGLQELKRKYLPDGGLTGSEGDPPPKPARKKK